jgi:hypothetical protein
MSDIPCSHTVMSVRFHMPNDWRAGREFSKSHWVFQFVPLRHGSSIKPEFRSSRRLSRLGCVRAPLPTNDKHTECRGRKLCKSLHISTALADPLQLSFPAIQGMSPRYQRGREQHQGRPFRLQDWDPALVHPAYECRVDHQREL